MSSRIGLRTLLRGIPLRVRRLHNTHRNEERHRSVFKSCFANDFYFDLLAIQIRKPISSVNEAISSGTVSRAKSAPLCQLPMRIWLVNGVTKYPSQILYHAVSTQRRQTRTKFNFFSFWIEPTTKPRVIYVGPLSSTCKLDLRLNSVYLLSRVQVANTARSITDTTWLKAFQALLVIPFVLVSSLLLQTVICVVSYNTWHLFLSVKGHLLPTCSITHYLVAAVAALANTVLSRILDDFSGTATSCLIFARIKDLWRGQWKNSCVNIVKTSLIVLIIV